MKTPITNAVLFARVSSQPQHDQGHALNIQIDRLKHYAKTKGFMNCEIFQASESTAQLNRKCYNSMINYIKNHKKPLALVVCSIDRLQRNLNETIELDELRKTGKIEIHSLRESMVLSNDSRIYELMMWDFAILAAKNYSLMLGENIRKKLHAKRCQQISST